MLKNIKTTGANRHDLKAKETVLSTINARAQGLNRMKCKRITAKKKIKY